MVAAKIEKCLKPENSQKNQRASKDESSFVPGAWSITSGINPE